MGDRRGTGPGRHEPYFEEDKPDEAQKARRRTAASARTPSEEPYDEPRPQKRPTRQKTRLPEKEPRSAKPRRSIIGRLFYWCIVLGLWGIIAMGVLVAYHASKLPPIDQLAVPKRPPNIAILGSDGTLLANRGETGGREISLSELPPYLPQAFIAIEDRRFYTHAGIDPIGIGRALSRNILRAGGGVQGGSTLTQQLAKNLFLTQERTASRKIQEAILALWLERKFSKNEILELYLNRVYFGSGAYGVEAAAQKYFGKSAREVTIAEAAILGGLVQSPSRLAPNRNPDAAHARASLVLAAMQRDGFISDAQMKEALARPADAQKSKTANSVLYAADHVIDKLDDLIGSIEGDLIVTTTLNPMMQAAAEKALTEELATKGQKFGVSQGALLAMDPDGAIRAFVGGRNYSESQFDRVTSARRQPGSAFKAFVYLAALEKGLTPDTLRDDAPINIKGWQPENYAKEYRGPVSLTEALSQSLNTVAVRLGLEVGPKTVATTAQRLGIKSKLDANASIALGTSAVTPIELVSAYASFANGGVSVEPYVITEVITREGDLLYTRPDALPHQVIDPGILASFNVMMRETLKSGTAKRADLPNWDAAGKTGTSQDFRDAWFIGYTGALVTGVWLGNDDNSPTKHVAGGSLPVEIWSRFMKQALAKTKPIMLPASDVPQSDLLSVLGRALFGSPSQNNGTAQKGPLILQPQTDGSQPN
ncbi:MAG: penicillin-binding protein [Alphaproteobacteria bacterium]|nr:penicillin-binding protein [Alphaproteobacteria bacterium]